MAASVGACAKRKERRPRALARRELQTVVMVLAEKLHHSAQRASWSAQDQDTFPLQDVKEERGGGKSLRECSSERFAEQIIDVFFPVKEHRDGVFDAMYEAEDQMVDMLAAQLLEEIYEPLAHVVEDTVFLLVALATQARRAQACLSRAGCGADWRHVLFTSRGSLVNSLVLLQYAESVQKLRVCCSRHRLHVTLFELISFQSLHTAHGQARRIWSELELSKDHTWSRIVDLLRLLVMTFTCMCTSIQTNTQPRRVTQVVEPTTTHATTQSFCDAIVVTPRNSRTMASAAILLRSHADASECTWTTWNWSEPHSSASIDCLSRGKRASEDAWRRSGRDAQPNHC